MRSLRVVAIGAFAAIAVAACSSNDAAPTTPTTSPPAATAPGATTGSAATTAAAPTSGSDDSGDRAAAASGVITIQNYQFGPPLSVRPGTTITVINKDSDGHDVVADDGSFTTKTLAQGQSATFTAPAKPGTYTFSCSLHSDMTGTGTLVVTG
jgi:plastocyanin